MQTLYRRWVWRSFGALPLRIPTVCFPSSGIMRSLSYSIVSFTVDFGQSRTDPKYFPNLVHPIPHSFSLLLVHTFLFVSYTPTSMSSATKIPSSLDLRHHLSKRVRAAYASPMKEFARMLGLRPELVSLAGGKSTFSPCHPIDSVRLYLIGMPHRTSRVMRRAKPQPQHSRSYTPLLPFRPSLHSPRVPLTNSSTVQPRLKLSTLRRPN